MELTNDLRNIEKIRSEVGMVFQQFNLLPHLTVLDNVTLAPIWVRKKPKAKAMELLERVGIPDRPRNSRVSCRVVSSSAWRSPDHSPLNRE